MDVKQVTSAQWPVVDRLFQMYVHDLSEFRGTLPDPTGRFGHFFVARGVRRTGVGRDLALDVIARHERPWNIAFQEENPGAARFWRGIAQAAFGNGWHEERRPVPDKPHIPPDVWILALLDD